MHSFTHLNAMGSTGEGMIQTKNSARATLPTTMKRHLHLYMYTAGGNQVGA